jgi:hypothetical protein
MATAAQSTAIDQKREMLRHSLATLAYRGGKVVRGVPAEFAEFRVAEGARTPVQILSHIGDLLDWAVSIAQGQQRWQDAAPLPWDDEVRRFHAGMQALEDCLASAEPLAGSPEALFQGPIADALTHVGQIALLRRAAGRPIKGENYYKAEIVAGRVGPEQTGPKREFD